jgi:alpha-L-arabinofuranosidase
LAQLTGITPTSASGEMLTAGAVDSVNTFDAPGTVSPKPVSAIIQSGQVSVTLAPKSVTVLSIRH